MPDERDAVRTRRLAEPAGVAHAPELAAGELVDDWQIVHAIARGGFGSVYEAVHRGSGQRAALKLLHAHLLASPEMVARLVREAEVIARLRHPNVVELVAAGLATDGRPYLCMELLTGEDLAALLARRGRLAPPEALALLEPLCAALAAAHERGIVHRDLKASNVMVCAGPAPRVVLLDFGIAKLIDALDMDLTASRQSLGTPACMAPEQIRGGVVGTRTDIYALGALAFHLLAGKLPFDDASVTMAQYLHLHARRPRVSVAAPVSPRADDVIVRAMALEPGDRFGDPVTFFAALRAALLDTARPAAIEEIDAAAVLVAARDLTGGNAVDEALLGDLEGILPAVERALAAAGFALALDFGSSAVFVKARGSAADATAAAFAVADQLDRRPGRDNRVEIAVRIHHGVALFAGEEIMSCAMLRPTTWGIPDDCDGVWASPAALGAETPRRLR